MGQNGKLGLLTCVMILIGTMIGSAIFSLSGLTILLAGPSALLSWVLAGAIMLLYGICMAELASRYPQSGGVYVFPSLAFGGSRGKCLGWLSCWSSMLTNIVAIAFSAIYVGQYLSVSFAWAKDMQIPLALLAIAICHILNAIRIELAGKINLVVVLLLLATILTYVVCGFSCGTYDASLLTPFFTQGVAGGAGFLKAVPTAIIGYSGVIALSFMVSEVRAPRRTIPAAIFIALAVVAAIYALVILSTTGLVTAGYLKDNPGVCFIPLFGACFTKLQSVPWLVPVVSLSAVMALMTTMMICVSMNARAIQAACGDHVLPASLGRLNRFDVPAAGSLVTCLCAAAYSCFPQFTQQIVNFGAVFNLITMALIMAALIKSHTADQNPEQIYLVPGGKITAIATLLLLCACSLMGILSGGAMLWLYTLGFLLLGGIILACAPKH